MENSRDFNPDYSEDDYQISQTSKKEVLIPEIITSKEDVASITNQLNIIISHISEDNKCREDIDVACSILYTRLTEMDNKELIDYYKAKIKERQFHVDCIFKAFNYVQRSQFAKELSVGSDRKERIDKATDMTKINKMLSFINLNNTQENT